MTVRGDVAREQTWPARPPQRMGPSPRSFAADAHGCIMVRPRAGRPHTSSRRDDDQRPAMASSPPIVTHPTKAGPHGRASDQGGAAMTSAWHGQPHTSLSPTSRRPRSHPCARRTATAPGGAAGRSRPEVLTADIRASSERHLAGRLTTTRIKGRGGTIGPCSYAYSGYYDWCERRLPPARGDHGRRPPPLDGRGEGLDRGREPRPGEDRLGG